MKPNLDGVDLKIARANECLAFLDQERAAFLARMAPIVEGYTDPDTGDYVFRIAGDPPPRQLGITTGEFAHALTSSLDNLLRQLILLRGGTHTRDNQFPIIEKDAGAVKNVTRLTNGVSQQDLAYIQSVQPYHVRSHPNAALPKSRWHPLALLSYLNNMDKHQVIPACVAVTRVGTIEGNQTRTAFVNAFDRLDPVTPTLMLTGPGGSIPMMPVFGFILSFHYLDGTPVGYQSTSNSADDAHRTEIVRVLQPDRPNTDMQMNVSPTFDMSFSGRERPMDISDLKVIQQKVVEIVEHFRPEFSV